MHIAIIGCGLIGNKRASAIAHSTNDQLVIVADVDAARAEQLARSHNCQATTDWQQAVNHPRVEAVIVATVNKYLAPITIAALERGKHVLVEKPMARNLAEAQQVLRASTSHPVTLSPCHLVSPSPHFPALAVGFNHRHHPAVRKAHELCTSGAIGPLMYIRAVYGHGGRPGYDKEWRADADLAGGGELLDQGVHIVDLCRWFLGEFSEVFGSTGTYFWNLGYFASSRQQAVGGRQQAVGSRQQAVGSRQQAVGSRQQAVGSRQKAEGGRRQSPISNLQPPTSNLQPPTSNLQPPTSNFQSPISNPQSAICNLQLEDNAFALLRTADGKVAQFHTSWTQWKNRFTFEVFGRDGYVIVDGLGGSYGMERLVVGRRKMENGSWKGGAPEEQVFEFAGPDTSWQAEWQEFTAAIREGRQPLANGEDGLQAMRVIDAIYASARTGKVVALSPTSNL